MKLTDSNNARLNIDLAIAQKVIAQEIEGLQALFHSIAGYITILADTLLLTKGKIIISGMGKSGYIARKIGSTLCSVGMPTIFLHPTEASHGDLGVISSDDTVILLSNSGESKELNAIISYCNNNDIKLVGISRNKSSTLAKLSNLSILLPFVAEANDLGIPTTSSIMSMALGDALTIVLKERLGLTSEIYKSYHPSGRIGAQLKRIKDIMHVDNQVPIVYLNTKGMNAIITMTEKRLGCTGVINEKEELVGIITDGDLRRHATMDFSNVQAKDLMTYNPITVTIDFFVAQVLQIMREKKISQVFIINKERKILGIVHIHDILTLKS